MSLLRQSPIRYRSTSSNLNRDSGIKLLNSTSSSFGLNKPGMQSNVSNLSGNSFQRRTSFSLTRNTQGRLDTLKDDLSYLNSDILQTRNTTKQASLYLRFMKQDLHDRKLPEIQSDLKQQIMNLKKNLGITIRSDKLRFQGIWQSVAQFERGTRAASNRLFELRNYITRLENSMGYYSGADKHRY